MKPFTLEAYKAMNDLTNSFPFKSSKVNVRISTYVAKCSCGKELENKRGTIVDDFGCVEVLGAGVCNTCKTLVTFNSRVYPDGRIMINTENGWQENTNTKTVYKAEEEPSTESSKSSDQNLKAVKEEFMKHMPKNVIGRILYFVFITILVIISTIGFMIINSLTWVLDELTFSYMKKGESK